MNPELHGHLRHLCIGSAQPLVAAGRTVLSAIVKRPASGAITIGALGLAGDEQANLSAHGGLQKAVYAYPVEHMAFWCKQRRAHGVPLLNEAEAANELPPGFMGENLTIAGILERDVWIGDTLHWENSACVLRVTAPREPCYKFNAIMGFAEASRLMVREAYCGFYLAVEQPGTLQADTPFTLRPGSRALSITEAIHAQWAKHRN